MTSTCIYNNDNCLLIILRKFYRIKMYLKIYLVDNQHCERVSSPRDTKVNELRYPYFKLNKENTRNSSIFDYFYLFQVTNCTVHSKIK